MLPFEQGGLDSLCGIYSIVNADKIINGTNNLKSQQLFKDIIDYLDKNKQLASVLTSGMQLKWMKSIFSDVIRDTIKTQSLHFEGKSNPSLSDFWNYAYEFHKNGKNRAVILSLSGVHDHWTIIESITDKQMKLFDSYGLKSLNRSGCTTAYPIGGRKHVIWPAQTYFLSN